MQLYGDEGDCLTVHGDFGDQVLLSLDALMQEVVTPAAAELQRAYVEEVMRAECADLRLNQPGSES